MDLETKEFNLIIMRILKSVLLIVIGLIISIEGFAREHEGDKNANSGANKDLAASCAPSQAIGELALNNVRFIIETGGNMWEDRAQGFPHYIVPKGTEENPGQNSVLFAGSLWMGGFDPANNLKLAAVRFRQVGNDFWPGPLANDGTASTSAEVCSDFDTFWRTTKQEVQLHALWWTRINDGDPGNDNDPPFENGYSIPQSILDWPGNGNIALHQDAVLGPFFDQNGDGLYEPEQGDYPWYDLTGALDCRNQFREDPVPLFGDENLFWIFNDNGNIHSETQGEPIGMQIRAQAFEFSTQDEINSMTFYNYVLTNQGSLTLTQTYFGQWVDCDVGFSGDDFVGCDVQRGLGFGYNGDPFDESSDSGPGYGANPPAIGVDFFEGPFQDADQLDNPLTLVFQDAIDSAGIPYGGIGIGYGDGVVDNERFGMRAFLYHNNNSGPDATQDPEIDVHYYNFLRGRWKDNSFMVYGGTGYDPNNQATAQRSFYMFPGETDPIGWGTEGNVQDPWSEETENNPPADRRFIQSAGPFILEPGNVNNITVGAVYGQSFSGNAVESVTVVKAADDKAQNLFDNCFEIVDGPDQPDMAIVELDEELILTISNTNSISNNFNETYHKKDPTIPDDILDGSGNLIPVPEEDKFYNFQGYQVYQLVNSDVSPDQLNNPDFARLIFQTDIEDNVAQIINYEFDPQIQLSIPVEKVDGTNEGVVHSFNIIEDAFAETDVNLINFKTYCFMVIAYGYNNFKPFDVQNGSGQPTPYLPSRKAVGSSIQLICGIPHDPTVEDNGTVINSSYGDGVQITRIEGKGTGGVNNDVILEQESIDQIMSGNPWKANQLKYVLNGGPVDVFVVDPLTVQNADFTLGLNDKGLGLDSDSTIWFLVNSSLPNDTIWGDVNFNINNEQLIPEYGIAVNFTQYIFPNNEKSSGDTVFNGYTQLISSSVTYEDNEKAWLSGVPDGEGTTSFSVIFNWLRSGTIFLDGATGQDYVGQDNEEFYETVINRTWGPFQLVQKDTTFSPGGEAMRNYIQQTGNNVPKIKDLNSINVVFTSDKTKWTRAAVLEAQANRDLAVGNAKEKYLRESPSIDKDGNTGTDEATLNGKQPFGMSWFPGYAINVSSGERLNIAFCEDSHLTSDNGNDMLWNPTSEIRTTFGIPIMGGQHYIYIFRNIRAEKLSETDRLRNMPSYDYGQYIFENVGSNSSSSFTRRKRVFNAATWVSIPLLDPNGPPYLSLEDGLIPTETTVRIRVARPYEKYATVADINNPGDTIKDLINYLDSTQLSINDWNPYYAFSTDGLGVETNQNAVAKDFLKEIRVVPNPYHARSTYESSRLDNQVRLINLPQQCTITIMNMSGTIVRKIVKDNPLSFQDWDLRNETKVPVASGMYIIHIDAGDLGEVLVKLMVIMRQPDFENF